MLEKLLKILQNISGFLLLALKKFLKILKNTGVFLLSIFKKVLHFLKFLIVDDDKSGSSDFVGTIKNIFVALIIALVIRSLLYEPFHIPSGSMKPGLKEGDFIFVSKYDFGYSKYSFPFAFIPFKGRIFFNKDKIKRGDVLVFRLPRNPKINYIKRLIGLPGDKVQMKNGILYINDKEISQTYVDDVLEYDNMPDTKVKRYEEKLNKDKKYFVLDKFSNGNGDNTPVFVIPEKHYFFLGDNRDNSVDSRFAETGLVPEENLIGKARIIFFSINDNLLKFWKWHKILRFNRMFTKIK